MLDALLVAWKKDYHAQAVKARLRESGHRAIILDTGDFPQFLSMTWTLDIDRQELVFVDKTDGEVRVGPNTGIWWRRPADHDLSNAYSHPKIRSFAAGEARHALLGALCSVTPRFLNPPYNSRKAALKPVQLSAAKSVGLRVPRTVVTNVASEVLRAESKWKKKIVYKVLGGPDFGFFETRIFNRVNDEKDLDLLSSCPTIFQEFVEGEFDLRVTIVGRECFPGKVEFLKGHHPVDSRIDPTEISRTTLSSEVSQCLCDLMDKLGLNYAAVDLRYSQKEGYTFFELNPEGQYLWMERHTGFPISRAVASFLVNHLS